MKNEFDSDMLRIQNECAIVVLYCIVLALEIWELIFCFH